MHHFVELGKRTPKERLVKLIAQLAMEAEVEISNVAPREYSPFSWDEARECKLSNVDFAPHTKNHYMLSQLTAADAVAEVVGSWGRLKQEVVNPLPILAYPIGRIYDITAREAEVMRRAGIIGAVTAESGYVHFDKNGSAHAKRYFVNRFSYPDREVDVFQCSSKIEYNKSKGRDFRNFKRYSGRKKFILSAFLQAKFRLGGFKDYRQINWEVVDRLIFLCFGNICRSPYAEARAKELMLNASSFGLDVEDKSYPANKKAKKVARTRYVDLERHMSKSLHDIQLKRGDLVLGMEPWHLEVFKRRDVSDLPQLSLLGLWGDYKRVSIQDPYGRDSQCFQNCFEQIDNALLEIAGRMANDKTE